MADQAGGLGNLMGKGRLTTEPAAQGKSCRVISITSGKGGVGKTNLAVNLSLVLAQQGLRVVLFDADLGLANVDVLMGIYAKYNLQDFLYERKTLREIMVKGPHNLQIIPGGSGIYQLANLNRRQQERFIRELLEFEKEVDVILIDTSAGLSNNVLRFISAAHELIVVTTPEPTSITDAYSIIKVVSNYKLHSKIGLVVNRVKSEREAREVVDKIDRVAKRYLQIKLDYLGEILDDLQVVQAVKTQKPFVLSCPSCKAAESVRRLALSLTEASPKEEAKRGLSGFLNKMIKLLS